VLTEQPGVVTYLRRGAGGGGERCVALRVMLSTLMR
jgi:hypothetical protein